jgi:hypothetical protein
MQFYFEFKHSFYKKLMNSVINTVISGIFKLPRPVIFAQAGIP